MVKSVSHTRAVAFPQTPANMSLRDLENAYKYLGLDKVTGTVLYVQGQIQSSVITCIYLFHRLY